MYGKVLISVKSFVASLPIVNEKQKHQYLVADFSDFEKYRGIISEYFKNNSVDILVNNTNGPEPGVALEKKVDDYQKAFDLVFKTVCETTTLALPYMIRQNHGRIINFIFSTFFYFFHRLIVLFCFVINQFFNSFGIKISCQNIVNRNIILRHFIG